MGPAREHDRSDLKHRSWLEEGWFAETLMYPAVDGNTAIRNIAVVFLVAFAVSRMHTSTLALIQRDHRSTVCNPVDRVPPYMLITRPATAPVRQLQNLCHDYHRRDQYSSTVCGPSLLV